MTRFNRRADPVVPGQGGSDAWGTWMAAAQAGNTAVYHRLLTEVDAWLRRYFARRLPPGHVDDAVQDTLLAIHAKRHTYDPTRPFGPWLAAVARHKWIDRLRAMGTAASESLTDDIAVDDHEAAVVSAWALEGLLQTLSPAQSDAIRLVKLQGHSIQEASVRTRQSASLVKVNIHRGLVRLAALVRKRRNAD